MLAARTVRDYKGSTHSILPRRMMSQYSLLPVSSHQPDGLSRRFLMPPREQTDSYDVLIVAFEGVYPDGSGGNRHADYIACETVYGLQAFKPHCVVLDLRLLSYRWGDGLLRVFQDVSQLKDEGLAPGEPRFPVVVVTSTLCRAAFLSLVSPTGAPAPIWHFDNIDAAITYAVQASKAWMAF